MGVDSPHHCPTCKKNPVSRCVDLGHMYHCPRHPEAYCLDKEGRTCVLCEEAESRFERTQLRAQRIVRDAQVAAALAARANTQATGKVQWDEKLPTVNKLAKTEANKAQQARKTMDAQIKANSKAEKAWKGARGEKLAKFEAFASFREDEIPKNEQQKPKGKPKLRIQRGR